METKTAIAALAALARESRLAVFRLLVQVGPSGMAASKIADQLGVPSSSLSFHLNEPPSCSPSWLAPASWPNASPATTSP